MVLANWSLETKNLSSWAMRFLSSEMSRNDQSDWVKMMRTCLILLTNSWVIQHCLESRNCCSRTLGALGSELGARAWGAGLKLWNLVSKSLMFSFTTSSFSRMPSATWAHCFSWNLPLLWCCYEIHGNAAKIICWLKSVHDRFGTLKMIQFCQIHVSPRCFTAEKTGIQSTPHQLTSYSPSAAKSPRVWSKSRN